MQIWAVGLVIECEKLQPETLHALPWLYHHGYVALGRVSITGTQA